MKDSVLERDLRVVRAQGAAPHGVHRRRIRRESRHLRRVIEATAQCRVRGGEAGVHLYCGGDVDHVHLQLRRGVPERSELPVARRARAAVVRATLVHEQVHVQVHVHEQVHVHAA